MVDPSINDFSPGTRYSSGHTIDQTTRRSGASSTSRFSTLRILNCKRQIDRPTFSFQRARIEQSSSNALESNSHPSDSSTVKAHVLLTVSAMASWRRLAGEVAAEVWCDCCYGISTQMAVRFYTAKDTMTVEFECRIAIQSECP
jgi:hypothetical protein